MLSAVVLAAACEDHEGVGNYTDLPVITTTSSAQGGSVPHSPCACLVTLLGENALSDPCSACQFEAAQEGSECADARSGCEADTDCVAFTACVGSCRDGATGALDLGCIGGCIAPPTTSPSLDRYLEWVECTCDACPLDCDTFGNAVCEPAAGGGGSGGMGGGGSGGAPGGGGSGGVGGAPGGAGGTGG